MGLRDARCPKATKRDCDPSAIVTKTGQIATDLRCVSSALKRRHKIRSFASTIDVDYSGTLAIAVIPPHNHSGSEVFSNSFLNGDWPG